MAGDPFCDQWSLRPRGSSVTFVTKCELPALWPPAPPSEIARAGPIYGGIARLSWDTFRDRIRPARSGSLSAPARIRTWDLRIRRRFSRRTDFQSIPSKSVVITLYAPDSSTYLLCIRGTLRRYDSSTSEVTCPVTRGTCVSVGPATVEASPFRRGGRTR